ncbi:MAG: response regulator transcription factor [Verrucomicrobiae bacterium]|nr:response regulator transcription factor [Verrucomicrobiae bacterium]
MAGGRTKFLIVDDHAGFRQVIRAFLPAGLVVECDDGSAVLERYATESPDWVLMDIELPGIDGFTATRQLKLRYPDARVIIISNHGEEEFRREARELGTAGFVHKSELEKLAAILSGL